MGGFFREEIGLTSDVEMSLRAAAYGPVGYIAEPLLHYTVRGDSLTLGLSRLNLARSGSLPPVAAALLSAMAVHEHRRDVSANERCYIRAQVADQLVGRALMHRYRPGGRGRVGAVSDLLRATYQAPGWPFSVRQLTRAAAAVLAPSFLISRIKEGFMARGRYF